MISSREVTMVEWKRTAVVTVWTLTTVRAGPPSSAGEPRAGQSVLTQEKPLNYCKFEFGAFMLPVGDRKVIMSQEGHFSISGHAAVSCYDCMRIE